MSKSKSRKRDRLQFLYPKGDTELALTIRDARLNSKLTQQELARKLGLRQRQISDLERATIDARLSTIQNVARALNLELMLIPRQLISAVEGLQHVGSDSPKRPMYSLGDDAETDPADKSQAEIGSTRESVEPSDRRRRPSKGPK